ncbi:MAG: type II toxin-antitoxin system VapC family toxin [Actinomycetota bacterium]|nr:type II toxin-antitoxin system VapC family toxin [Actinomycetota bacterium]
MSVVLDANVLVALLVADERQPTVRCHVEEWLDVGEELNAPAVLPYEVANVLARLVFEGVLKINDVTEIWQDLAAFDLQLHPFNLTHDGPEVAEITTQLRRRHATDSTYVCLARRLETTLWTLDSALARNAADLGLPVKLIT